MEVSINKIVTSPTSLRFGCVVRGDQNSWVRFVNVVIDEDDLGLEDLTRLGQWITRQMDRYFQSDPDSEASAEQPLF